MTTALLAFTFMLVLVAAMAVGVAFGRKPISGSCGGMKALGMNMECEICGGNPQRCESESSRADARFADRAAELGRELPGR
jgi:hypothetical protein